VIGNAYTTTTCASVTTGPTSVDTCSQTPPVVANSFVRIICTGITPGSQAYATTGGPDGSVWFTEYNGRHVGKFDLVTKLASEYGPLLSPATSIAAGPDGNVWFAERSIDGTSTVVGRITPAGVITEFTATPVTGVVRALVTGADGRVWFVKDGFGGPAVGKIDPATGTFTSYSSGLKGAFTLFGGIALGGDGNVWFTEYLNGLIGRITPSGAISEFGGIAANAQLNAISPGPAVAGLPTLWVTDPTGKSIAKVVLH
jgi:streptogramin lyase